MKNHSFGWNTNPIYNSSNRVQQVEIQDFWKNNNPYNTSSRQQKIGFLSTRSSPYDADNYNGHLPPNLSRSYVEWTNQSHSTEKCVTQRLDSPVHTSDATSNTGHQSLSSPQRRTITSMRMTVPTDIEMRPRIQAHYSNQQDDPRYCSNQGSKPMNRKEPTWNLHRRIPHDVTDHDSRSQTSRDEELEALKNELQEVKRNMRNMAEVILHIIANDIRDQQNQQNGSAVETQQYSTPSQYLPNDVNTHVTAKHHYKGVPNAAAEIQSWDSQDNPGIIKPVGFEKHRSVFRDYPEKKDPHYLPGILKNQFYEGQIQDKKMTFGAGNSPISSYPPTSGLPTYKSDHQGCETLKFESQHFEPVSVNVQGDDTSYIQGQHQSSQQYRSELEQLSSTSIARANEPAYEISIPKERSSDRKREISLACQAEDVIPIKYPRQNQMAFSSTAPGQSVLSSHMTKTCTMQSPFAIYKNAWKEPPQQRFVYENGVVNQRPLIHQEMQEKKYMYYQQTAIDEKGTRREKARRCYSCREPGHLADNCCKVADPDIVDDLSLTNDTALDLSIDKH